jgi:hypothetical protein
MASPPPASTYFPAPGVAPYHPPPAYAPPSAAAAQPRTDGRAASALVWAILGLIFAIPLGLPGMIAGPIAYFLARSSRERIAESNGALTGSGTANAARIIGVITTIVGCLVTLAWFIVILNALNDVTSQSSF